MINPELGTDARPDVTGIAKYDSKPVDPLVDHQLGISRGNIEASVAAAVLFGAPYSSFKISWDFPELKFGATGYEIEASRDANFEMNMPELERANTGISHVGAAGIFDHVNIVSINPYDTQFPSLPLQPNTQYYARVRALGPQGELGVWSEELGMATAQLPDGTGGNDAPTCSIVATHVPGATEINIVPTSAPNAVTAVPLYDGRVYAIRKQGGTSDVVAEGVLVSPITMNGTWIVKFMVIDEDSKVAWSSTEVLVTGIV